MTKKQKTLSENTNPDIIDVCGVSIRKIPNFGCNGCVFSTHDVILSSGCKKITKRYGNCNGHIYKLNDESIESSSLYTMLEQLDAIEEMHG